MSVQEGNFAQQVPELVHDALVDMEGDGQEQRVKGYVRTQSINEVFKYIDPDDVIRLEAKRLVKDKTESFGRLSLPSIKKYTSMEEQLRRSFVIDYDRVKHGKFNWPEIRKIIDEEGLGDVAVTNLVYRFESQELYERLGKLLNRVLDFSEDGGTFFNQPFHAELRSRAPGHSHARQEVRTYNEESIFVDLGWKVRTLDLDAIWSFDAWRNEGMVNKSTSMRRVEELVFNHVSDEIPQYGAVNSPLVVNQWKKTFGPGVTNHKEWEWTEEGDWEQVA